MSNYIRYANQGATRNQPLSNDLTSALGYLADLGVTAEVFSGGQPAEGPNRVGSHRHDHGGAADVFFYQNGRRLDWSNPDDVPIFQQIVSQGRANGLTGFGAGDNYMQPGSIHLGFGPEAVWGAGGRGTNAPDWLRQAFYGAGSAPTQGATPNVGGTGATPSMLGQPAPTQSSITPEMISAAFRRHEEGQQQPQAEQPQQQAPQMAPRQQAQGYQAPTDALAAALQSHQALQQRRKGLLNG